LDEMVRVVKPGGSVAIHESTWRTVLSQEDKDEISERYGTPPLEFNEWRAVLKNAGVVDIETAFDEWSAPEMFWKIRMDRDVDHPPKVLTAPEGIRTMFRVAKQLGLLSVWKAFQNGDAFFDAVTSGKLGHCLYWGRRAA